MAMTATERSRVLRERRASGMVVLTVVVTEDELAEIARAGYAEAASTDRSDRAAVSLFLSDMGLVADAMTFELCWRHEDSQPGRLAVSYLFKLGNQQAMVSRRLIATETAPVPHRLDLFVFARQHQPASRCRRPSATPRPPDSAQSKM